MSLSYRLGTGDLASRVPPGSGQEPTIATAFACAAAIQARSGWRHRAFGRAAASEREWHDWTSMWLPALPDRLKTASE